VLGAILARANPGRVGLVLGLSASVLARGSIVRRDPGRVRISTWLAHYFHSWKRWNLQPKENKTMKKKLVGILALLVLVGGFAHAGDSVGTTGVSKPSLPPPPPPLLSNRGCGAGGC
jgi:hypothetical protein